MVPLPFRRRVPLLAALLLALPAAPALAARDSPLAWPGPEVRAGEGIELTWDALPPGFDELEILLSLDDGRRFAVRVSPELEARQRRFFWRVPNLPTGCARLRMRMGSGRDEIDSAPTPPFRIVGVPESTGSPKPLFHEGVMWRGYEPPGSTVVDALSPAPRLGAADPDAAAAESPPRSPLAVAPSAPGRIPDGAAGELPTAPPAPATLRPPFTPLRN